MSPMRGMFYIDRREAVISNNDLIVLNTGDKASFKYEGSIFDLMFPTADYLRGQTAIN